MIEQDIISDVADIYGITPRDITSKSRVRRCVDARAVACYILRKVMQMTLMEIGRTLNCTHASVIYHTRRAGEWLDEPLLNHRAACAIKELEKRYTK